MKKFLRGLGIALMLFNGIGFVAILLNVGSLITGMEGSLLARILSVCLFFLMFGGLFLLGYKIWSKNRPSEEEVKEKAAKQDGSVRSTDDSGTVAETRTLGRVPFSDDKTAKKLPGADTTFYTVIANYLELPFHDGDRFFLFEEKDTADAFIAASERKNLHLRVLTPEVIKKELSEYLCCGYTGAVLKKTRGSIKIEQGDILLSQEELISHFNLPGMDQHGNITPALLKRMHNYLIQLDYTARKYESNPVPEHWQKHMQGYKGDVIRLLLEASLCLPSSKDASGKITFSILTAKMPNGDQWASLFTDQFAIARYTRKTPDSIVFPGLLSDVANDIRSGKLKDMKGIMINPGREEFRVTVEEIEEQKALRHATGSERVDANRISEVKTAVPSEKQKTAATSEKQMQGFFKGLLPGERPESSLYLSEPGAEDVPTKGFIGVGTLGGGYGWSYLYYDPFYRRFLKDEYGTGAVDDAETRYYGRTSYWPEELLQELAESKDPKAAAAAANIRKIIAENPGFAPDSPKEPEQS